MPKQKEAKSPLTLEQFDALVAQLKELGSTPPREGDFESHLAWMVATKSVAHVLTSFVGFLKQDIKGISYSQIVLDATESMLGYLNDELEGTRWAGVQPNLSGRVDFIVAMSRITLKSTIGQLGVLREGLPALLQWKHARIEYAERTATWRNKLATANAGVRREFYKRLLTGTVAICITVAFTFLFLIPEIWTLYQAGVISGPSLIFVSSLLVTITTFAGMAVTVSQLVKGASAVGRYHELWLDRQRHIAEGQFEHNLFHPRLVGEG